MLAFELLKGYFRRGGTPKCMMQLDLQKAYDMVAWHALEIILKEIGLPCKFIKWIMLTVTIVTYIFNLNGNYAKPMAAKRGIRQGDPLFPLLFVIVMEYLNKIFLKMQENPDFNPHAKCEKLKLTKLTFAYDLLLLYRDDHGFVELMLQALNMYLDSTGLKVNESNNNMFMGGLDETTKVDMMHLTRFKERRLPFRYLVCLYPVRG